MTYKYERRLRLKQEIPLGVPFIPEPGEDYWWIDIGGKPVHSFFEGGNVDFQALYGCGCFQSEASAKKQAEMLREWHRDGLVANAKGEPIDIHVLLPLLKKGWVAMDKNGAWHWYAKKPKQGSDEWIATGFITSFHAFNIKRAEDWKNSLMECGL